MVAAGSRSVAARGGGGGGIGDSGSGSCADCSANVAGGHTLGAPGQPQPWPPATRGLPGCVEEGDTVDEAPGPSDAAVRSELQRVLQRILTSGSRGAAAGLVLRGGLHGLGSLMHLLSKLGAAKAKRRAGRLSLVDALKDTLKWVGRVCVSVCGVGDGQLLGTRWKSIHVGECSRMHAGAQACQLACLHAELAYGAALTLTWACAHACRMHRFGAFLGAMCGIYVGMDEGLAAVFGKQQSARWRAAVAGAVAGQVLLITGSTTRQYR
eukprot:366226-Chlamydomonas_euryale.AAC.26